MFLFILIPVAILVLYEYKKEFGGDQEKGQFVVDLGEKDKDVINKEDEYKNNKRIKIVINEKEFVAVLENNETADDFFKMLPIDIKMSDMNENEKYYEFEKPFINTPSSVNRIKTGDIMLWDDNTLVLFYKGIMSTSEYTVIGHILDVDGLVSAVGKDSVDVHFEIVE